MTSTATTLALLPRTGGNVRRVGQTVHADGRVTPMAVLQDGRRVTGEAVYHLGG